jgi:hypothetical protein
MGYVHLTDISQFIPPADILKSAGTWTPTYSSNVHSDVRGAAEASFVLHIPIPLPASESGLQGAKLESIDVWYKVATANMSSSNAPTLNQVTLPADTVAVTGAAITTSLDADHDTEGERVAQASHKMTITVTTPVFLEKDNAYFLYVPFEAAAGSVFTLYGAQANFTLRL